MTTTPAGHRVARDPSGPRRLRRAVLCAALAALAVPLAAAPAPAASASAAPAVDGPTVVGSGYGHGRGLSQWGSLGYAADQGWDHGRILDHYYGGTTAGRVPAREVSVRLQAMDGVSTVLLTSAAADHVVEGTRVPAGSASRFVRRGDRWAWSTSTGGCAATTWGPEVLLDAAPAVWLPEAPGDDTSRMLTVCRTGTTYRGNFRPVITGGTTRLVNHVLVEDYLRSVVPAESPASWADVARGAGAAALRAQAVAARSYALSERRSSYASSCDTTSCQVYGGAARGGRRLEDRRSDAAVAATAGEVRLRGGAVVRTEFSASTGGYTAGGDFPAVRDLGDDTRSPYRGWSLGLDTAALQRAWPAVGLRPTVEVLERDGRGEYGGRVLRAAVAGASGRVVVTGAQLRSALGLRSELFEVRVPPAPGLKRWDVRTTGGPGPATASFSYGLAGDVALACDVDGDGKDGVVVYRDGRWDVRDTASAGAPQRSFDYGAAGWVPVCGDWDGDGKDGIGVYDGSRWYLRGEFGPGPAGAVVQYGWPQATPVVGDWDGDGRESIGVYHDGDWLLRDSLTPGRPDRTYQYGFPGAVPVPGHWGDGRATTLGVWSGTRWWLRSAPGPGAASAVFQYGPAGSLPVVGDWSGRGRGGVASVVPAAS